MTRWQAASDEGVGRSGRWSGLHPHYHVLVADGVFFGENNQFAPLPPPDNEEVDKILRKVVQRVSKLAMAAYPEGLPYASDAKAVLSAASVQTRPPWDEEQPPKKRRRCAFEDGFSLHADTSVHENDRKNLERLCRYGARGPLALERLSRREDGRLEYRLKRPTSSGATTLVMTPLQLLKRLCALMVKPKIHLTRFFGVFAPHSKVRAQVVLKPSAIIAHLPGARALGQSTAMARGIAWGDIRLVELGGRIGTRPALVLTRTAVIPHLNAVTLAPITKTIRGARAELKVDI